MAQTHHLPENVAETAPLNSLPANRNAPIVIDFGTGNVRAGYAGSDKFLTFPSIVSKFRDRKNNTPYLLVGNSALRDAQARQNLKTPFEGPVISNWDAVEYILDYSFSKLNVASSGYVENPLLMTEPLACPNYQRNYMQELIFEQYNVPAVAYGVDSLFSYRYNNGTDGIAINCGHESTTVIPVSNGKSIMSHAKRLNIGSHQASNFLLALLQLKYPAFPAKLSSSSAEYLMKEFCYVSAENYREEIENYLNLDTINEKDIVIQYPFVETQAAQKSEEELARIAERRKESGRRLKEQNAKARLEKLMQRENDLEYWNRVLEQYQNATTKREQMHILNRENLKSLNELEQNIKQLEKVIKRSRKQDIGDDDVEPETSMPKTDLLDIPDEQLTDDQIKEKKAQKLQKANWDARMRAKKEKMEAKALAEIQEREDEELRKNNLERWLDLRRKELSELVDRLKEKERLKTDLSNKRSIASQQRMKNIANLASDSSKGKRGRGKDDDDTFGANDDDWGVYRDIAANESDEEEEEQEIYKEVERIEQLLLKYDESFTQESTLAHANDTTKGLINIFLRGGQAFDPESKAEAYQLHLNVERIKVPEILFQPSMAGVDQAGIAEIVSNILNIGDLFSTNSYDTFLTGGFSLLRNLDRRLHNELIGMLPWKSQLNVRRAADPIGDAWRGMSSWASEKSSSQYFVTKAQYDEMGSDYAIEHGYGNAF
ncbi:hypothetical protein CANCADRAFT_81427 [Tortispora caseinolytica NRRL Y-17796]|uniref:Actin-related protein 5 n=1 Tax=Tortispora caseinolytica NRRL Y-17796 TaxID=767744 RepID=A0A1E4TK00_9ASCO|nr:hypothetical protein CANCADRAFT_81427 [Tortispora caseinolytica NRRL Y-17796]